MTDAERRACAPRPPWISRDLYAEMEITTGQDRIRLEVRAFRLDPAVDASLMYCAFRLDDDGSWRELRGDEVPAPAAREGSRLVATARVVELSAAVYGEGESIDRTREVPQGSLDLWDPQEDAGLVCDRCGRPVPEGEHHGHGFEVLCEGCYGGRYDAHAAGVAAAMLEEIGESMRSGERIAPPSSSGAEAPPRRWASEELRELEDRYGEDYATDVQREAARRVVRRIGRG